MTHYRATMHASRSPLVIHVLEIKPLSPYLSTVHRRGFGLDESPRAFLLHGRMSAQVGRQRGMPRQGCSLLSRMRRHKQIRLDLLSNHEEDEGSCPPVPQL